MSATAPLMRWLTAEEAASALGCHQNTVYERAKRGEYRTKRIGRLLRIDPASILPEGMPAPQAPARDPVDLKFVLQQVDIAISQMQALRQQVAVMLETGK